MRPEEPKFSFQARAAEKAAARADDEARMRSGEVPPAVMARANGGSLHGARYKGPCKRLQDTS
jgi:hypothetical protein